MAGSIIQTFLDSRYIKTDQQDHINSLNKSASVLVKYLQQKNNKHEIISYILVALDQDIPEENKALSNVEQIIIKNWPTFRNSVVKTKDKPKAYIHAVILEALLKMSKEIDIAGTIWLVGSNVLGQYKPSVQHDILVAYILEIGGQVEQVARINWDTSKTPEKNMFRVEDVALTKVKSGGVSEENLKNHLLAAAVHSGWAGLAGGGENPHSHGTANHNWPQFLAERAAQGLATEINSGLSSQRESINALTTSIRETLLSFIETTNEYYGQLASSFVDSSKNVSKRSELLWWKQSLYSEKLNTSYRKIDKLTLALALALDLSDLVSSIYPKSVDYLLVETMRDVLGDEIDRKVEVSEITRDLCSIETKLKTQYSVFFTETGDRKTLGACFADILKGDTNSEEFSKVTGIEESARITLGQLVVWLFHDLQANKITNHI